VKDVIRDALTRKVPEDRDRRSSRGRLVIVEPNEKLVLLVKFGIGMTLCLSGLEIAHLILLHTLSSEIFYNILANRNDPWDLRGAKGELAMGAQYREIVRALVKIRKDIRALRDLVIASSQNQHGPVKPVYLSTGIQTTIDALKSFSGPTSAEQVAKITKRSRAVESLHLNELYRTGLASKGKRSRVRVFMLKEEYRAKG
jgi:DNA-binding transcriptional ArsR family regulator